MAKKPPALKVDFSGVEARTTYPEGDYRVKLDSGSIEEGNEYPYIAWTLEVTDGKFLGKKIGGNSVMTSLSPKALWNLRGLLEAAGVEVPDEEFTLDKAWIASVVEESNEFFTTIEHEKYEGKTQCKAIEFFPADEAEEKPAAKKGGDKAEKSGGKKKPDPEPEAEAPDFDEMDKDELKEFIDEHDLDVDPDDFPKVTKLRAAVADAFEARGGGADENAEEGETYTEDAINEMGTKELQAIVDKEELDVELDGTTKSKRRTVLKALKKAGKIEA